MYFVRSGNIYLPDGSLWSAGDGGTFWSSVTYPADVRYAFYFFSSSINAYLSNTSNRYLGFPLRVEKLKSIFISILCISSVVAIFNF